MLFKRLCVPFLLLASLAGALPVQAQTSKAPELVDAIVAIVGTQPITLLELQQRMRAVAKQNGLASGESLRATVLDALINERAQAQAALDAGIRVDDADIDQAEQAVAAQNQLTVDGLRQQLSADGLTVGSFRRQLRDQLLVQRIREREVNGRINITQADINQFLSAQAKPGPLNLQVAHILVAVPESASAEVLATAQAKAQQIAARAKAGEDFAALARELSNAGDAAQGGDLGLRALDEVPPLFAQAVANVQPGEVGDVVRSGAGLHVVKLLKRQRAQPVMTQVQTRARHILLRAEGQPAQTNAIAQLEAVRAQLVSGQADFAAVAASISQDGSAQAGGDLGWARPGMFVPEFEAAMDRLDINDISPPVVSRFGVHLIQVLERARVAMSPDEQNAAITNLLREQKGNDLYAKWARDVRARAYVDIRQSQEQ